jgi:hypothetical protein
MARPTTRPGGGHTVSDVARRHRVSEDKIRRWIALGQLKAINTSSTLCGRPRYVILPEDLADFEARRSTAPPPKPARRKKRSDIIDFYPDAE